MTIETQKMRTLAFFTFLCATLSTYGQPTKLKTAADYAALAQQFAQDAVLTRQPEGFYAASSNILEAVALEPTNQDYLVTATSYLDLKTRFTEKKELDACKFAEQAIQLSGGANADAYFHAAKALNYIGSPAKAYTYAQQALKLGGLSTQDEAVAQKIVKDLEPRKTILWHQFNLSEIRREPWAFARGNAYFYYPVPPDSYYNQTAEYQVFGTAKWEKVDSNGDTFLRIWPGAQEIIEIRIEITRFPGGHNVIFEDHSQPLPIDVAPFTNSTSFINSSAPEIQAEAMTLKMDNWVNTTKAIADFVYEKVKYVDAGSSDKSSTTVLQTKTGMCMDQANLCVALARANGIPARMVLGCEPFEINGKFEGLSAGHVWPEVYIPGTGWCEFGADDSIFGHKPWHHLRLFWRDTEKITNYRKNADPNRWLDLPIAPPLINLDMERIKYLVWFGMTEHDINQLGTRWHMIKEGWQ